MASNPTKSGFGFRAQVAELGANRWTGGQYSLLRILLALVAALTIVRFLEQCLNGTLPIQNPAVGPNLNLFAALQSPAALESVLAIGLVSSIFLLLGLADRLAGFITAIILFFALRRFSPNQMSVADFLPWLLILHLLVPPAPYGSVSARGRPDPAGGWIFPPHVRAIAWVFMSLIFFGVGIVTVLRVGLAEGAESKGLNYFVPLAVSTIELLFPAAVLAPRLRLPLWTLALVFVPVQMLLLGQTGGMFSLMLVQLFAFDPGWIAAKINNGGGEEAIFYDGECGLCHAFVRFVLAEDKGGVFNFSPLQSERYAAEVKRLNISTVPDSVAILSADRDLLFRTNGIAYVLDRLGGIWRILAVLLRLVPRPLRDTVYNGVALIRKKVVAKPSGLCPIVDGSIMRRFTV